MGPTRRAARGTRLADAPLLRERAQAKVRKDYEPDPPKANEAKARRARLASIKKNHIVIMSYTQPTPLANDKGLPACPPSSYAAVLTNVHKKFHKALKWQRWEEQDPETPTWFCSTGEDLSGIVS